MNYMSINTRAYVIPMKNALKIAFPDTVFVIEPALNVVFIRWHHGPTPQQVREVTTLIYRTELTRYV